MSLPSRTLTYRRAGAVTLPIIAALLVSACQGVTGPAPPTVSPTPVLHEVSPPSPVPVRSTPVPSEADPPEQEASSESSPPLQAVPFSQEELTAALPLIFEGTFEEPEFGPHPMALVIERMQGNDFFGQLRWPTFDTTTAVVGEVVTDFDLGPWELIDDFDPDSGIGFAFTETEYLTGDSTLLGGWYYGLFTRAGVMRGLWVNDRDSSHVQGSFLVTYSLQRQP